MRIGFAEAVGRAFRRMFNWSGRATRPEYLWFMLFRTVITLPVLLVAFVTQSMSGLVLLLVLAQFASMLKNIDLVTLKVVAIALTAFVWMLVGFFLITAIAAFALAARRLHDGGRRAWSIIVVIVLDAMMVFVGRAKPALASAHQLAGYDVIVFLIVLLFFVMESVVFILCVMPSKPEDNRYGPYLGDPSRAQGLDSVVLPTSNRPDRLD